MGICHSLSPLAAPCGSTTSKDELELVLAVQTLERVPDSSVLLRVARNPRNRCGCSLRHSLRGRVAGSALHVVIPRRELSSGLGAAEGTWEAWGRQFQQRRSANGALHPPSSSLPVPPTSSPSLPPPSSPLSFLPRLTHPSTTHWSLSLLGQGKGFQTLPDDGAATVWFRDPLCARRGTAMPVNWRDTGGAQRERKGRRKVPTKGVPRSGAVKIAQEGSFFRTVGGENKYLLGGRVKEGPWDREGEGAGSRSVDLHGSWGL